MKLTYKRLAFFLFTLLVFFSFLFLGACGEDDDDDDSSPSEESDDDDDITGDDDTPPEGDVVPTTLDLTLMPVKNQSGEWEIGEWSGESHFPKNDLQVEPTIFPDDPTPLSVTYFMTLSDLHHTDEESPTRLTFFDSAHILFGAFDSAFRPQEDLGPQILNALVRTANRVQEDYERDFDFLLVLGDATDNAQFNEMKSMIDVLDGTGLLSGMDEWARPDSGDLALDNDGFNLGERDFGIQEFDSNNNNINAFERPGYPNSNADFPVEGIKKSTGEPLPWFYTIGNHDVLNTGNFEPDSFLTFFSKDDYTGDLAKLGFIPGIASAYEFWEDNPSQTLKIDGGIFGLPFDWGLIFSLFDSLGLIEDDYYLDIDDRFDLMTLLNDTPEIGSDDGVTIASDTEREFMGHEGLIPLVNSLGHGFSDNDNNGTVDQADGGWYRIDWDQISSETQIPLRLIAVDTTDVPALAEGGMGTAQFEWLSQELDRAIDDQVLVIVFSHHQEHSIVSGSKKFQELLHGCPNVILHLCGHGHDNMVEAMISPDLIPQNGYWEVETPSLIEYPQQSRIFEIVDNRDGTGMIYVTLLDHWPIMNDDSDELANLGRVLAFEDKIRFGYDGRSPLGGLGRVIDRNVALKFAIPSEVASRLAQIEYDGLITSVDSLGTKYIP